VLRCLPPSARADGPFAAMRPVVITVFDSETGQTTDHTFATSPVRIGRNPLNDLPLPFPFVSGWHAVVRFDESGAKFFDLGSTNGTLLNGRKIQAGEAVAVADRLSVTIGKLELRLGRADGSAAVAPGPVGYAPQPPMIGGALGGGLHGGPVGVPVAPTQVGSGAMPSASPHAPAPVGGFLAGTIDPERRPAMSGAPVGEGTAHVQLSDVHRAIQQLRPRYEAFRSAWAAMFADLQAAMHGMHRVMHEMAVSMFAREFPGVDAQPEFAALAQQLGARLPSTTTAPSSGGAGDLAAVQRLSQSLRPEDPMPRSPEEAARFLACVEDVLRASAKAFVELQKGQEQFGNEMGVRTIKEFTPLHAAGTADNVLKYLLDWQKGGPHRTQELVGVYADLMIHQVALINGVMEGVRSMLARLDPAEIERTAHGAFGKSAAAWRSYVQRYEALTESDRNITEHVFGPDFARAYAEVGGEGAGRR
jgi:type VI secretion system protein